MYMLVKLSLFTLAIVQLQAAPDPTLYEYYTSGGIRSGLQSNLGQFALNGKPFVIYSGSFHYFRVVPQNWRTILQRFKAAGLNAVDLYVPWNLHEDIPDLFDFESAGLNLATFLQEIKAADMFAIVRPGPYICAEWEFGGYPSWLLHDPNMQFRTMYTGHLSRVKIYMERALSIINQYQFSTSGGPVIMLQLENEYGGTMFYTEHNGTQYYNYLYDIVRNSGFKEQLFTSDGSGWASNSRNKDAFKSNDVLQAVNLPRDLLKNFNLMRKSMPNKPTYASEYWTGWLDLWNSSVHQKGRTDFDKTVSEAVLEGNGSVNFYMFIGGTNFGFTNAAGIVTSYDYGAPLSESGNYTENYYKTRQIYQKLVSSGRLPKTHLPDVPPAPVACAYGKLPIQEKLSFEIVLEHAQKFSNLPKPVPMEMLNFTEKHNYGQRFGFILYRVEEKQVKEFKITGKIRDHAIFMVDQRPYGHIVDGANNFTFNFTDPPNETKTASHKYDLLVENLGRPNTFFEIWSDHWRKGILGGDIVLDGQVAHNITIYSLDFNATFVRTLSSLKSEWQKFDSTNKSFPNSPSIYRAYLNVDKTPEDTYLLLPGWTKGIVLVNGFNIGRYWSVGPQKTLYIPGPLLKQGDNSIEVFELHQHGSELQFLDQPILE